MSRKDHNQRRTMVKKYEVIGVALWKYEFTSKEAAIGCVHDLAKIVRDNPAELNSIRVKLHYTNNASIQFEFPEEKIVVELIEEFSARTF